MATSDIKKGPLYVDSTNNRVGVGTASPATALDVTGSVNISNSSGATLKLTSTDTSGADTELLGQIDFVSSDVSTGSAGTQARIKGVYEDNGDSTGIAFLTGNSTGSGSPTINEVMRIRHEGNVGIGDVSPDTPLAVKRDNPSSGRVATFGSNGTPFTGVAAGLANTVTISRTLRTVAASTTTSLVSGYGGSIALITLLADTGVNDIQYTFLVTHGWNSASVLFSNSYGANTATFTFSASNGVLQVNHNHSGAIKFNVATLVVPGPGVG